MDASSPSLESLFAEVTPAEPTHVPGARPPRMRYSHQAMCDLIVQNPWISQGQIAAHFGYTQAWVSTIITSDAFQALLAARREEVVDPVIKASLEERMKGLVHRSIEVLMEKLERPATAIPDNVALRALELGARGIELGGFGRPQLAPSPPPPPNRLEQLAGRLIELQENVRRGVVYKVEVEDAIEAPACAGDRTVTTEITKETYDG